MGFIVRPLRVVVRVGTYSYDFLERIDFGGDVFAESWGQHSRTKCCRECCCRASCNNSPVVVGSLPNSFCGELSSPLGDSTLFGSSPFGSLVGTRGSSNNGSESLFSLLSDSPNDVEAELGWFIPLDLAGKIGSIS